MHCMYTIQLHNIKYSRSVKQMYAFIIYHNLNIFSHTKRERKTAMRGYNHVNKTKTCSPYKTTK